MELVYPGVGNNINYPRNNFNYSGNNNNYRHNTVDFHLLYNKTQDFVKLSSCYELLIFI